MNEFLIDLAFSTIFTLLKGVIKSEKSKAEYKKVLKKVYTQIGAAYPEFSESE